MSPPLRRRRRNIGRSSNSARRVRAYRNLQAIRRRNQSDYNAEQPSDANDPIFQKFIDTLNTLEYVLCVNCKCLFFTKSVQNYKCASCKRSNTKFTSVNNMEPGHVPDELRDLTHVEQMLIARVNPVLRIYQLRAYGSPGQYRYSGNIINVEQDIQSLATTLPQTSSNLNILLVRRNGSNGYKDFRVRRSKVLAALQWLIYNNPFYRDVTIDTTEISNLPEDGDISQSIRFLQEGGEEGGGVPTSEAVEDDVTDNGLPIILHQHQETSTRNIIFWPQAGNKKNLILQKK